MWVATLKLNILTPHLHAVFHVSHQERADPFLLLPAHALSFHIFLKISLLKIYKVQFSRVTIPSTESVMLMRSPELGNAWFFAHLIRRPTTGPGIKVCIFC